MTEDKSTENTEDKAAEAVPENDASQAKPEAPEAPVCQPGPAGDMVKSLVSVAVVVVLFLLVARMFGGSPVKKFKKYIPKDVAMITYVDFAKIAKTDLGEDWADEVYDKLEEASLELDDHKIDKLLIIREDKEQPYRLISLKKGVKDLDDIIDGKSDKEDYKKVEYAELESGGYVAKLKKNVLAFASSEEQIEDVIKIFKDGKGPKYEKEFKKVLGHVDGEDFFTVNAEGWGDAEASGSGISVGNKSVSLKIVALYDDKDDAEEGLEEMEDAVDAGKKYSAIFKMFDEMDVKVSGKFIKGSKKFKEEFLDDEDIEIESLLSF